ncbi:MAG: PilT/PilU family type 4a pilus ATPase [Bacillati bacterium ANGP1]|uniref:PilT/PilU family type 4a pilus ATPase n=1 Tax=Candidatus Segetimicrobium genomatis TaxID=2569760 RepID=A0A537LLU8_9BACT|nr:MAG: PilT/PilU family type 4a pilus ATPase [Terrabacteria group bacterium ANGP1]
MDINELLVHMVTRQASDLYIKTESPPMLRISGQLSPIGDGALAPEEVEELAGQMMQPRHKLEFEARQQVNLAYHNPTMGRYRVNIYMQRSLPAMVIRRINTEIPSFEELRLPKTVGDLALAGRGLVIVTGPAGSGKSTTLAAMIDHRNRSVPGHIVTIEDPIEFVHLDNRSLVSQREVGSDCDSFGMALRDALRQAPDVILIGEMRDVESAQAAVHFAETGHLVLTTLHSINASQVVERILTFFPAEAHDDIQLQLSLNMIGVLSQRLIPRKDGEGMVLALELMLVSPHIRELIRKGQIPQLRGAIQAGAQSGMQTFDQAVYTLIQERLIDAETGMQCADSPNDLRLRLRGLV